ncbi:MAG: sulfurtransferase, partial [Moraxellaceae bacterium]
MNTSLISASELKTQLGKSTVIFDCRFNLMDKVQGQSQYRQGHIPGAYYLDLEHDLSSPVKTHGGRHPLPDFELLQEKLRRAGVNQHSTVVVYDDSRMAYAARTWWLLKYMGHGDVRILNGGFQAWVGINGALDRREPQIKPGNFKLNIQGTLKDSTVSREDVLGAGNFLFIDSREPRRYEGIEEPIDPVAGHIEGAVNYPWQAITDDKGFIKDIDWQKQHWNT